MKCNHSMPFISIQYHIILQSLQETSLDQTPNIPAKATSNNPVNLLVPGSAREEPKDDIPSLSPSGTLENSVEEKTFEVEKSALEKDIETALSTFEKNQLIAKHKELLDMVGKLFGYSMELWYI